jgi:ribosomal protein S18 acetylase RimI-like enzyme
VTTETRLGIPKNQRITVSEIFLESFHDKFKRIFTNKSKAVTFLSKVLRDDRTIVACKDGIAVGFAGLDYDKKNFMDVNLVQTAAFFGLGIVRILVFGLVFFLNRTAPNEVHLNSLAVSANERGKGIGKKLLDATIEYARQKGCATVKLDVVETNLAAKQLYERFGFRETKVQKVPFPLNRIMGFGSATEMVYML